MIVASVDAGIPVWYHYDAMSDYTMSLIDHGILMGLLYHGLGKALHTDYNILSPVGLL